jgi:hypothetical protein
LAIKKFSRFARRRRIAPRQNQFFERIADADSRPGFGRAMRQYETDARSRRHDTTFARDVMRRSDAELALE